MSSIAHRGEHDLIPTRQHPPLKCQGEAPMTQQSAEPSRPSIACSFDIPRGSAGTVPRPSTHGSIPEPSVLRRAGSGANDSRQCAGSWTDPFGTAHFREVGTGLTFCGAKVDPNVIARATSGCDACVAESFMDYARHHECGSICRANADEAPAASDLELSTPQASVDARINRRVSWSGRISAPSESCRDLELLERVRECLHHL